MPIVAANGIKIAYDEVGDAKAPVILLIMGLGTQMIAWPEAFCLAIAQRGFRVVRFLPKLSKDIVHTLSTMRTGTQVSKSTPMRARDVTGISRETSGTSGAASASCAMAGNETATRSWSAAVGHCQPHAADIPSTSSESTAQPFFDQEDAIVDRKIQAVCRGC
jgi:hypothetical protein